MKQLFKDSAVATGVCAFAAISSLLVSAFTLVYTIYSHHADQQESVKVVAAIADQGFSTHVIPFSPPEIPGILPVQWECIIVNNGSATISFVEHRVSQLSKDYPSYYSNMDEGVYSATGEPINFPLSIPPGSAVKVYVRIGLPIDPRAYAILSPALAAKSTWTVHDILFFLASSHIDFYGNRVDPKLVGEKMVGYAIPLEGRKEPLFVVGFKTGRGRWFFDAAFWYRTPDHET